MDTIWPFHIKCSHCSIADQIENKDLHMDIFKMYYQKKKKEALLRLIVLLKYASCHRTGFWKIT